MYFNLLWVLILLFFISVSGLNFNVDEITKISLDDVYEADGSYFGYSLLLQKGLQPLVIVGAPKQSNTTGGAVFACDINNLGCTKYDMTTTNVGSFNGNFLGAAIDGDDTAGNPFVACAPRKVTQLGTGPSMNYFLKGSCFYHQNSSHFVGDNVELMPLRNEVPISNLDGQYYYDFAFGQAGIDAVYLQDSSSIILGAPGIKNWNGAILIQSLKELRDRQIIPTKRVPEASESNDYLGYKVGGGNIVDTHFYFAGAPRADNLLGNVKLYTDTGLYRSFKGEEIGSFFGSAVLAEDVNDDKVDDLFIGAPMSAGSTFDEGCVYFYKNALSSSVKLIGRKSRGARFGSNIVALGDIDLDSYNDIAISAPYEDDGIGAVYIFMGSTDGIKTTYSQRLSPSSFPGFNAKGFGMGISRGNDIDGNGHNDLAIGAYQTGHVLVIRTKSVIDFRTALESNVSSIASNGDQMSVRYCVYYKPRSTTQYLKTVDFQMKIILDYRVKGQRIHAENVTAYPQATKCNQIDVTIEQSVVDIVPFRFVLSTGVIGNVMAEGTSLIEKSIPYSHGCGNDNICQTKIEIKTLADTNSIILGLTSVIDVKVSAVNHGEPGYQCKLLIQIPKELELRDKGKCTFENSTYSCQFASKIDTEQERENSVIFDVENINVNVKELEICFEVKCLGENIENKQLLKINVSAKNLPYIEGKSLPEDFEYNDENKNQDTEVEIYHTFTLGNFGPSPVKSDVFLLVPIVKFGQEDLFHFIEAGGNLNGVHVPCYPTNVTKKFDKNYVSSVVTASLSRTVVFDCFEENSECLELNCQGDYLYKSSEIAKYILRFKTTTSLLAKFFQNQEKSKNILAYISSAYLFNGTRIESHAATLILFVHSSPIPLWVYIVSSISGVVLLGLIILLFYKCHFFDRRYRDKMNGQRLMDLPVDMDTDTPKSQEVKESDTQEDRYE